MKKKIDVHCKYCKYKGNEEELRELQYVYDISNVVIFECPRCETQDTLRKIEE